MREQKERPNGKDPVVARSVAGHPDLEGTHRGPLTSDAVLALQGAVGNRVVAQRITDERHVHDDGCGHTPVDQRALVDAALRSPGRPLDTHRRRRLEAFHQTDLSDVRLHTGPVAQRSTAAIGAKAFTVGSDIVLDSDSDDDDTIGHETRHVQQQRRGRVAGTDNGAGMSVSSPAHPEEREAAADGAAFGSGAERAPSIASRPTDGHDGGAAEPAALGVQRMTKDAPSDLEDEEGEAEEGRAGKGGKKKTKKQLKGEIAAEMETYEAKAYGGGWAGRSTDEVRLRFARDMAEQRPEQTLSHLSFLLHDTLGAVQAEAEAAQATTAVDDREMQGMMINDRLLFASNFNDTVDNLRIKYGQQLTTLRELLRLHQSQEERRGGLRGVDAEEYLGRLGRAEQKVEAVFEGLRGIADDAAADALRARVNRPIRIVEADSPDIRELLTSPAHAGSVIMLRFGAADGIGRKGEKKGKRIANSMHAEQKFLVAIHRAGLTPEEVRGAISIAGKYRPCMGCAAALRYYRDALGFGTMQFNPNYGPFFMDSVDSLITHLRHVVDDPRYLEYIRGMIDPDRGGAVSTSALAWQAPPPDAHFDNGFETRVSAEEAQSRPYRTDSESEGEVVEEDGQKSWASRKRKTQPYDPNASGKKLGKGNQKVKANRRVLNFLSDKDAERLKDVWENGTREEQAKLFRYYASRPGSEGGAATEREIHERSGAPLGAVNRLISGRTGHEKQYNRPANPDVVRKPRRARTDGAPAERKPRGLGKFKKGIALDAAGEKRIRDAISAAGGAFLDKWEVTRRTPDAPRIPPGTMPPRLARLIADLRSQYTVPSMAGELQMSENALKNHLNRTFGSVNAKAGSATPSQGTPAPLEDVEMGEASDVERDLGYEEDSEEDVVMGGTAPHPQLDGYQRRYDAGSGQHYYVDERSGGFYSYDPDTGGMVLLPADFMLAEDESSQEVARPSASGAMDVDSSSEEEESSSEEEEEEEPTVQYGPPTRKGKERAFQ